MDFHILMESSFSHLLNDAIISGKMVILPQQLYKDAWYFSTAELQTSLFLTKIVGFVFS